MDTHIYLPGLNVLLFIFLFLCSDLQVVLTLPDFIEETGDPSYQTSYDNFDHFIEQHCSQTLALNFGSVEAVRLRLVEGKSYPNGARCAMRIQAPEGKRLQVKIETFDIKGSPEYECQTGDFVSFIDGANEQSIPLPGLQRRVCSHPVGNNFASSDRFMVVQFVSDNDMVVGKGMSMVITAFSNGPCTENQFQCKSSLRCIQKRLECDGTANCCDGSDEALPKCFSTAAIAGIAVGGAVVLIAIVVCIVLVVVAYIKRKRARTIRRAMVSEQSPHTFWYSVHHMERIRSQLESTSSIDPIWDGGSSNGDPLDHTDLNRTLSFNNAPIKRAESSSRKVTGPGDKSLEKVPSGFWDIHLDQLYDFADNKPSSEV